MDTVATIMQTYEEEMGVGAVPEWAARCRKCDRYSLCSKEFYRFLGNEAMVNMTTMVRLCHTCVPRHLAYLKRPPSIEQAHRRAKRIIISGQMALDMSTITTLRLPVSRKLFE